MTADSHPDGQMGTKEPERVTSTTKVNVAFPFSEIKIQEPGDHLIALTGLVEELARLVPTPCPPSRPKLCDVARMTWPASCTDTQIPPLPGAPAGSPRR